MISKSKQSDWFSIMPSQQAQDFGRSTPDPYPSRRRGLGTRLVLVAASVLACGVGG